MVSLQYWSPPRAPSDTQSLCPKTPDTRHLVSTLDPAPFVEGQATLMSADGTKRTASFALLMSANDPFPTRRGAPMGLLRLGLYCGSVPPLILTSRVLGLD